MRQKIELEIVSYCSNLKRKAEIFKAAGGLFCLKEEPRKEVRKRPISIIERPILSASNLGNSDQRLAMAGEQLRCSTWQMKKGGIPTFLSAQTIDDSDRGTCWHVGQGEAGKAEEPEWMQFHKTLSQISPGQ